MGRLVVVLEDVETRDIDWLLSQLSDILKDAKKFRVTIEKEV